MTVQLSSALFGVSADLYKYLPVLAIYGMRIVLSCENLYGLYYKLLCNYTASSIARVRVGPTITPGMGILRTDVIL